MVKLRFKTLNVDLYHLCFYATRKKQHCQLTEGIKVLKHQCLDEGPLMH